MLNEVGVPKGIGVRHLGIRSILIYLNAACVQVFEALQHGMGV